VDEPEWWRGATPAAAPRGEVAPDELVTGCVATVPQRDLDGTGLRPFYFFDAAVSGVELSLTDAHLSVEWSEFTGCHFRQKVRPVLNELGIAAQGSFGVAPALYRGCTFERIRFKLLGGFSLGAAWFEDCRFVDCRWEGHFAHHASLVRCTFEGRMNGCVWFGRSGEPPWGDERPNVHRDNDFTHVRFTDNVAWRASYPLRDQRWPEGFVPVVDDA
jgi:hypothetical protein